ncbi:hypothetical protein GCM10009555_031190 [Acrocarpospora macrocephala]|uniref:Uncharacterized protein n=1 Tax=Acrocarpospora macrocephala TaxID=150177 RepID=A0A5M3WUS9_9ACTN|nr:hypothetical protein Amac_060470 [Acrocarpospora macrocephala]
MWGRTSKLMGAIARKIENTLPKIMWSVRRGSSAFHWIGAMRTDGSLSRPGVPQCFRKEQGEAWQCWRVRRGLVELARVTPTSMRIGRMASLGIA